MGPVEAQDEVRVPAVQEEVCCPEGDREALDALAEVSGEPEVRDEGIHEDILGTEGAGRKEKNRQSVSWRSEQGTSYQGEGDRSWGSIWVGELWTSAQLPSPLERGISVGMASGSSAAAGQGRPTPLYESFRWEKGALIPPTPKGSSLLTRWLSAGLW